MKIKFMSDTHIEFSGKQVDVDFYLKEDKENDKETVLCLAGDIGLVGTPSQRFDMIKFLDSCAQRYKEVIYIAGNHEFYNNEYFATLATLDEICQEWDNVHFLSDELQKASVEVGGFRFIGDTMWSNIPEMLQDYVSQRMNDFRICEYNDRILEPKDTTLMHMRAVHTFKTLLQDAKEQEIPAIVVSHHLPTFKMVNMERYGEDPVNHGYATDLENEFKGIEPVLWVCGHTHDVKMQEFGTRGTKVAMNCIGYDTWRKEEPDFFLDILGC